MRLRDQRFLQRAPAVRERVVCPVEERSNRNAERGVRFSSAVASCADDIGTVVPIAFPKELLSKGNHMEQKISDIGNQQGILSRVKERATAQLTDQKEKATDSIDTVAQAVRQSTQQLRDQQHGVLAQYVEQAADQLDRLSTNLRNKDVSDLISDAEGFARRQPALFVGAAFAVGVIGARFLKSSAENNRLSADQPYGTSGRSRYPEGVSDVTRY